MTYVFEGDINLEHTRELTQFVSSFPEDAITVYINSDGGSASFGRIIRHELESHGDVTLIAHTFIGSAAFQLFKDFNGEKKLVFGTLGMTHKVVMTMVMDESKEFPYGADNVKLKALNSYKKAAEKDNKFLSKKELKLYKNGDDVYFSPKRMQKIFSGIEVI